MLSQSTAQAGGTLPPDFLVGYLSHEVILMIYKDLVNSESFVYQQHALLLRNPESEKPIDRTQPVAPHWRTDEGTPHLSSIARDSIRRHARFSSSCGHPLGRQYFATQAT